MNPARTTPNRRQQILEQATRMFSHQGYDGTPVRALARACGVTEAALYRHFDSKAHLYEEVIRHKARQHAIRDNLAALGRPAALVHLLTALAEQILSLGDRDPDLIRLMFNNSLESGKVSAVLFSEVRVPFIDFLTEDLTRRIGAGEVRPVEPYITSRCFVGMVMDCALNVSVWKKVSTQQFAADEVVCNNVPIFARGLLADRDVAIDDAGQAAPAS